MKVIFLGRKPHACKSLEYLIHKGIEVAAVVAPNPSEEIQGPPHLASLARRRRIPVITDDFIYSELEKSRTPEALPDCLRNIDWVLSFLFVKKIKKPLIDMSRRGCINFHPAPLPDYRGLGGYNFAIYESSPYWGVAAHFVNESFDKGDLILARRFKIRPEKETALSLERKTQQHLFELFKEVVDQMIQKRKLPRTHQGNGRYIDRKAMEKLRLIEPKDTLDEIKRKIRAYWYPPYKGAVINIHGEDFTIIDDSILKELGELYHPDRSQPKK